MISNSLTHRQVWDLLPWLINGSASPEERAAIEEHLHGCADCRDELAFQRSLQQALVTQSSPELDTEVGWRRLSVQLDAAPTEAIELRAPGPAWVVHSGWAPWLVAAMIVEALGLGAMGTALWSARSSAIAGRAPIYRTLAAPQAPMPAPAVRAVFTSTMTLAQLLTLLSDAQLRVVSGPSASGVWTLAPLDALRPVPTQTLLQRLRARPDVRLAEPLDASP